MNRCTRCQGFMFPESVIEARTRTWLWACLNCGDRMDETIWFHRSLRRLETMDERNDRIMRELLTHAPMGESDPVLLPASNQ